MRRWNQWFVFVALSVVRGLPALCTVPVAAQEVAESVGGPAEGDATLRVGDPAPRLAVGKWIKGEPVAEFAKGKVYVIEFWGTWCKPCVEGIPFLSELQSRHKDVIFIGQNFAEPDTAAAEALVEVMGDKMNYRVALDDTSEDPKGRMAVTWWKATGQNSVPVAFVVDQEGRIAWIGHPMRELETVLQEVVAGTFDAKAFAGKQKPMDEFSHKLGQAVLAKDFDKALQLVEAFSEAHPESAGDMHMLAFHLLLEKKDPKAGVYAASLAETTLKDDADRLNGLAWMLVGPESQVESPDLEAAEKIASRANELREGKDAQILDTLAWVSFRKGDVPRAIELESQAIGLLEQIQGAPESLLETLRKHLETFQAKADGK